MELMNFLESNWFAIALLASVGSFTWKVANKLDSMKNEINDQFKELESRIEKNERYRAEDKEREKLIMQGVEATLRTLHSQGANGPVTESLKAIDEYKSRRAVE